MAESISRPVDWPEPDMRPWQGRVDPEADALRWHQCVAPYRNGVPAGDVVLGFACDAGVARNQGRVGAAEGPLALRQALAGLAWHRQTPLYDAGDVACHDDALEAAQAELAARVAGLLDAGQRPLVLGGGHEVAFASWSGLAQHCYRAGGVPPRIGIVNLDAHLDLRDPAQGASSGTPFAQIAARCQAEGWGFHYACFGASRAANTRTLWRRAEALGVTLREDREIALRPLAETLAALQAFMARCDQLYLTLDLDVLPAAQAPGVSAPAAYGVALAQIEALAECVRDSGKLRVIDIAELNPRIDSDGRTARAAARLLHQLTLDAR